MMVVMTGSRTPGSDAAGAATPSTEPPNARPIRHLVGSGGRWEPVVGYSRAVRVGNHVFVAGTTAGSPEGPVGGDDAGEQAREALRRIEAALGQVGASAKDVVRTRIFVTDIADFEAVGRAHGDVFADIRPVTTIVEVAALAEPPLVVEVEAEAVLTEQSR